MGADQREYVDAWVEGWVLARQTPPAVRVDGGWRIETGTEKESRRYVLNPPTSEALESVLGSGPPLHTFVKFPGEPAEWVPRFPDGWEPDHPGRYMTRTLDGPESGPLPEGYLLEVEGDSSRVSVRVVGPDGALAARGQAGLASSYAVPDQIVTVSAHRRRGLASVVMAELERAALDVGLRQAVLSATTEGQLLYEQLGWHPGARLTAMYLRHA